MTTEDTMIERLAIRDAYRNYTMGYETALAKLEQLGMSEGRADDFLFEKEAK